MDEVREEEEESSVGTQLLTWDFSTFDFMVQWSSQC